MKKAFIITLIVVAILGIAGGIFVKIASKLALFDIFLTLAPTNSALQRTNVLVLGVDEALGHRADTIMVLNYRPAKKEISLVSIPRDTLASLPGRGLDKINHAYAYGGVKLAKATVENFLNTEIPYYIIVNLSGIAKIIDEMGGITLNIDKKMSYVDYAGNLFIDLKPGKQKLSGKKAVDYVRYRSDGGDMKRIARQQKFLKAVASEITNGKNFLRSPKLLLSLLSLVKTNLNAKQTLGLCLGLRSAYDLAQVKMTTLPGYDMYVDGIYYMRPDETKLEEIRQQFNPNKKVATVKSSSWEQ